MRSQLLLLSLGLLTIHLSAVEAGNASPTPSPLAFVVQPEARPEAPAPVTKAPTPTTSPVVARAHLATATPSGPNGALVGYLAGESLTQLANDLALGGKDQARDLVHGQMIAVQRRYLRDHPALTDRLHTNLPLQTRNDVLSLYARGESLGNIAFELGLYSANDAREVVRDALSTLSITLRHSR